MSVPETPGSQHSPPPSWPVGWLTAGLVIGGGLAGAYWAGSIFLEERLAPLIAEKLEAVIERPVALGPVEQVTWNSLRLGPSRLPATATDPTQVAAKALQVRVDWWHFLQNRELLLGVEVIEPDLRLQQTAEGRWTNFRLKPQPQGPFTVRLDQARLHKGRVTLIPHRTGRPQVFDQIQATARQRPGRPLGFTWTASAQGPDQSRLEVREGQWTAVDNQVSLTLGLQGLPLTTLAALAPQPLPLTAGRLTVPQMTVAWVPGQRPQVAGEAQVEGVTAQLPGLPGRLTQGQAVARVQGTALEIQTARGVVGPLQAQVRGTLDLKTGYQLTAQLGSAPTQPPSRTPSPPELPPFTLAQVFAAAGRTPPALPIQGQFQASARISGPLNQPQVAATVTSAGPIQVDRVSLRRLEVQTTLNLGTQTVDVRRLRAELAGGGQLTGQGQLQVGNRPRLNFSLFAQGLPADTLAQRYGQKLPFPVGTVNLQGQILGDLGRPQIQVAWQAPHAPVTAFGEVVIQGNTVQLSAQAGPATLVGTLQARWSQATPIEALDLAVTLQPTEIATLPVPIPAGLKAEGLVSFEGRLLGTLRQPQLRGDLALDGLRLNRFEFEPLLSGPLALAPGAPLDIDLEGGSDRIRARLSPQGRLQALLVQRQDTRIVGRPQGDLLALTLTNLPLSVLGLSALVGRVNATALLDERRRQVQGEVRADGLRWGNLLAEGMTSDFRWAGNRLTFSNGELRQRQSRYQFQGFFQPGDQPQWEAQVQVVDASITDLAPAFSPPSTASAADLFTRPAGRPQANLFTQLAYFDQLLAQLQAQLAQQQQTFGLPDPQDLRGQWRGQLQARSTTPGQFSAVFNLLGQDWVWDTYKAERVVAQGTYAGDFNRGQLTLSPVRLQQDDMTIVFAGQLGGDQQSGQLLASRVPIPLLRDLLPLPPKLKGFLNAEATLAGSLANPQAKGEIQLVEVALNGTPLEGGRSSFSFGDSRLRFGAEVRLAEATTEPLEAVGSIPFQVPFSQVKPDSDEIRLDLQVENEGLTLLNLLTPQAQWLGGEGRISLQTRGTFRDPEVTGLAQFQAAKIGTRALPKPIEAVTGEIRFQGDRLRVESLQGELNGGLLIASGELPIADTAQKIENPLTLRLDNLKLDLENLYRGQVKGAVAVTGSLLKPRIGGRVNVTQGQIQFEGALPLPTQGENGSSAANANGEVKPPAATPTSATASLPAQFQDFEIALGPNLRVTRSQGPEMSIEAEGVITLNGSLSQPQPSGRVRLPRGEVNLYLTRFRLDRNHANRVQFFPQRSITDPDLDLRLLTTVTQPGGQGVGFRFPRGILDNEIPITVTERVAGLETVRIQAAIKGPVARVPGNLELTSVPSRGRDEILALIGGFSRPYDPQGGAELFLANLAGSALLNSISRAYDTDFGGISWRFFPTLLPVLSSENRDIQQSALALGGEVRLDVGAFSASFLQILTSFGSEVANPGLSQLALSYRFSDSWRLRVVGASDGDNRVVLEYQSRF
ncbi:MAG: translocation/assembly module TamB domain-containing protein [Gloeomargaritaceae cyanobacterium C42_A2020_066]|nr:translocation/assembly module TamB domain-containing protein [Gloeomargaritaceae cyanobacterium C42_A2020_066]